MLLFKNMRLGPLGDTLSKHHERRSAGLTLGACFTAAAALGTFQASPVLAQSNAQEMLESLPCESITRDKIAGFGGSLYRNSQAFGVPAQDWNDQTALAFMHRIRACFGANAPDGDRTLPFDAHFSHIWSVEGPNLVRENEELNNMRANLDAVRSALVQIDLTAAPAVVLQRADQILNLLQSRPVPMEDRIEVEARLSDIRLEANIRISETAKLVRERTLVETAEAEARMKVEEAKRAEEALSAARDRMKAKEEADARQQQVNQENSTIIKEAQERQDAAAKQNSEAEARRAAAAAEAELAEIEAVELALQKAEQRAEAEALERARNPACVAADAMKVKILGEPSEASGNQLNPLQLELVTLTIEAQAGETASACKRLRDIEVSLEKWRAASAKCNLEEAIPANMALQPIPQMKADLRCGKWF